MKIRQGFVSNSSSSSFVALGFAIEDGTLPYRELAVALGKEEAFDASVKKHRDTYKEGLEEAQREAFSWDLKIDKEDGISVLCGSEDGVGDKTVVALMLAETDDYNGGHFGGDSEVSLNDSNPAFVTLSKLRDAIGGDTEIKIFYGTRCC